MTPFLEILTQRVDLGFDNVPGTGGGSMRLQWTAESQRLFYYQEQNLQGETHTSKLNKITDKPRINQKL